MINRACNILLLGLLAILPAHALGQQDPPLVSESAEFSPQDHLNEILKRPMYNRWRLRQERARSTPNGLSGSIDGAFDRYGRWLEEQIFNRIGRWFARKSTRSRADRSLGRSGPGTFVTVLKVLGWVCLAVVLVFVGVAIYRVIADTRFRGTRARVLGREHVRAALEAGDALAMDSNAWLDAAEDLSAEGDLRAVYRALYLALLSGLHAAHKIDFRRNRTNWVYVGQFRGSSDEKATFHDLTRIFDHVWYGLMPSTIGAIAPLKTSMARLLEAEVAHA